MTILIIIIAVAAGLFIAALVSRHSDAKRTDAQEISGDLDKLPSDEDIEAM